MIARATLAALAVLAVLPAGASAAPCALPDHPKVCDNFRVLHRPARPADRIPDRAFASDYVDGSSIPSPGRCRRPTS